MNIFKLTLTMFAKLCVIVCLCVNIWAEESKPEYQNALNNLISRLGTTTNNTSDNLVFMPPTFSVDIVSLLRWAVETQTQQASQGINITLKVDDKSYLLTSEHFYPQIYLDLVGYNGKSYFFSKDQKFTWIESLAFCRSYGMDLVSIETAEEDKFISQHLNKLSALLNIYWTSGNKVGRSNFLWTNGKPLIYTNWNPGEPSHLEKEHCIVLRNEKWHDWRCHQNAKNDYEAFFICEQR